MKVVEINIDDLIFAEYNPRELTKEQYKDLRDSISRFGLVDPLIVNSNPKRKNVLVGGHQRARIAKDLGFEKIHCALINLDINEEKELNIRLNKNQGQWDWDELANNFEINELKNWGFSEEELSLSEQPELEELTDSLKEKPLEIKIILENINDFDLCIQDVEHIVKKYSGSRYSVSGGEI